MKNDIEIWYFYAKWCGPCHYWDENLMMNLNGSYQKLVKRIDVDEMPLVADRMGVTTLPTLVIICDGKIKAYLDHDFPSAKSLGFMLDAFNPDLA